MILVLIYLYALRLLLLVLHVGFIFIQKPLFGDVASDGVAASYGLESDY